MLGTTLEDPFLKEGSTSIKTKLVKGIGLLPLKTIFHENKITRQIKSESIWPCLTEANGYEIHNGVTVIDKSQNISKIKPIFKNLDLGWYIENNKGGTIAGTYIHGIFENDDWRDQYINLIRKNKNLSAVDKKTRSYKIKREFIIDNLANEFKKHLNLTSILS